MLSVAGTNPAMVLSTTMARHLRRLVVVSDGQLVGSCRQAWNER
jgi:hypothetical protein